MQPRWLYALSLVPIFAFGAFEVCVYANRTDAPPVDDSDLASRWTAVPEAGNGRARLLAAAGGAVEGPDFWKLAQLRQKNEWDSALARAQLAPNESVLAALDASLASAVYQPAELEWATPDSEAEDFVGKNMGRLVRLSELCAMTAIEAAWSGTNEQALDGVVRCLRWGHREAAMPGARLLDAMSASWAQTKAVSALRITLPRLRISAAESRKREAELEATRFSSALWRDVWAEEYRFMAAGMDWSVPEYEAGPIRRLLVPPEYSFQPNRTRAALAHAVREVRASLDRPCTARPSASYDEFPEFEWRRDRLERAWDDFLFEVARLRPNGVGTLGVADTVLHLAERDRDTCFAGTLPSVAQALIALRAYSLERGELPPSLDALVPDYLSRVPIDHHDGAPLRYSRDKKAVWALGVDLKDDGGEAATEPKDARAAASWRILF
jgi:hypothetical protein